MNIVTPRRPSGFPEFLPHEQAQLQGMLDTIRCVYQKYGFLPIETPAIELAEVLLAKGGGETEKEVYRFTKGDKEYALHYDLTVPLARYVAEHENDLAFPFRRYQMQKVWRAERAQKGRYREFYQCDADIIGSSSIGHDAELVALLSDTFSALEIGSYTVHINNRKLITGFIEAIGLADKSSDILHAIDKLEKIGVEAVTQILKDCGCGEDDSQQILDFVHIDGSIAEIISQLEGLNIQNDIFTEGLKDMRELTEQVQALGVSEDSYTVDLKIVRGLDYYTGTVYETIIDEHPEFGSVCSGGRYDNLADYYTKTHLPGVGVSIGLSRLFAVLKEASLLKESSVPVTIFIANFGKGSRDWALKVASILRQANISTQVELDDDKPAKQFKYADKLGVPYTLVIGEEEVKSQKVMFKNMASGEQEVLSVEDVITRLSA
ncbi:histidine--tRNA ligase [Candidatus Saccharibacteria bacterium]|nr:histidine--tRNA ligase [Candidatus Saccharibacteria bacterium]